MDQRGVAPPLRNEVPHPLGPGPARQAPPPAPVTPRRRAARAWLIALLIALILGWLIWRVLSAPTKVPHVEAPQPVGTAKAGSSDMHVVLTGLGTVTPLATITVQTQISGQLMSVGFQEGQIVNKGDFLAQIDPRPYQVSLAQAEATLAHDEGLLGQAKSDLARYQALNRQDSISKQQVTDQRFLVQQDEGTVAYDRATVDSARLNLAYCHITSPVTGRVGLRLVDPGNYVQTSGATGLAVVTQVQPISVIFVLPEDDIPDIAAQMNTGATLTVDAYDHANARRLARGTLTTLDNTVDTTTGTVKLRATFPNADFKLFPNQFVNARLQLKTIAGATQVPTASVQHGAPGSFVYVVKPDSTVSVQAIQTGITDGDETQILSGLQPGETVVTDGTDRLKDGAHVRVAGAPSAEQHKRNQPQPDQ